MSYHYPKSVRVRTRRQYQRIAQQSTRHVGSWVIIDVRPNNHSSTRLGITASRHYGKAVQRNRFKRIVREAFRLSYSQLTAGLDLNVKPRSIADKAKMEDILKEFLRFFSKQV